MKPLTELSLELNKSPATIRKDISRGKLKDCIVKLAGAWFVDTSHPAWDEYRNRFRARKQKNNG